jgi:hypothetical protein
VEYDIGDNICQEDIPNNGPKGDFKGEYVCKFHISIADKRYMIFMKSSMTTACDETFRSIKRDGDKVLQSVAEEFYSDHYDQNLFMGRVKYKVTKGQKIQKHHT